MFDSVQYSGKYSRRNLESNRNMRRMPYMGMGRCNVCGTSDTDNNTCDTCNNATSYSMRAMRNRHDMTKDNCDLCDIVNLDHGNCANTARCERHENNDSCKHKKTDWCDQHFSLAMGYVYPQEFYDLNESEEALCRGTLFKQLDMPFYGPRKRN